MSLLYSSSFNFPEEELRKNMEFMESNHYHQNSSGPTRYRSAPSTLLESLVNGSMGTSGAGYEDYRYDRSSTPEIETFLAKYMLPCNGSGGSGSQDLQEFGQKPVKLEKTESFPQQNEYSNGLQMMYQNLPVHNLANDTPASTGLGNNLESPLSVISPVGFENSMPGKVCSGNGSSVVRQSSSPAELFSNLGVDNAGFTVTRDVGKFRTSNGCNEESSPASGRLYNHINFSSGPSSCSRPMPRIAEIENETESMGVTDPENGSLGDANANHRHFMSNLASDSSWHNASLIGVKRARDADGNLFCGLHTSQTQNGSSCRDRGSTLTHHLSLPKTSGEMSAIEKMLQFQGSVPCKIRAKRGCATHPRSIAERVRRSRISERMRRLQELFPNLDKQTNTADMLDIAVEYIKDLQKQVKTLTDTKAKCTCSSKHKQYSNASV